VEAAVEKSRDIASRSSGISRSIHQLCVIITEAAEEENNHAGNEEVNMQVDKIRSNGKKEKEKVHVSAEEWRMIMGGVAETSKVVDVLLLLRRKQHLYARGHMLYLHYTLCLMQLSVVRNLILVEFSD
jgi:hypothetical protein